MSQSTQYVMPKRSILVRRLFDTLQIAKSFVNDQDELLLELNYPTHPFL